MNIKDTLKHNNLTKSAFADAIGISRPTLDQYIDKYKSGQRIPKERYQEIFDRLFSKELSIEQFRRELAICSLIAKNVCDDKNRTALQVDSAVDKAFMAILNDSDDETTKKNKYAFIEYFIKNYSKNRILDSFSKYISFMNYIGEIDTVPLELTSQFVAFYQIQKSLDSGNASMYDRSLYEEMMTERGRNAPQKKPVVFDVSIMADAIMKAMETCEIEFNDETEKLKLQEKIKMELMQRRSKIVK